MCDFNVDVSFAVASINASSLSKDLEEAMDAPGQWWVTSSVVDQLFADM